MLGSRQDKHKLCFSGPTRVLDANGISIASAVFARLTRLTDRPTDHATWSVAIGGAHSGEAKFFIVYGYKKYLLEQSTQIHHACLSFVNIHQMAPPLTEVKTSNCSLILIYRLRRDKRLNWPGWLVYLLRTVYPHKWSPVSYRFLAGRGKFAGQRPTFYRCATKPSAM